MKHLKSLDTLRALAALIVVVSHVELFKKMNNVPNLIDLDYLIFPNGHLGVILFFVLSGFLITYLLTKENQKGKINYKSFYIRRILRIWPLYYLILILSFFIFQPVFSNFTIFLSISIFPNIAHVFGEGWSVSPQIWSIGVEEQFYLFWPFVLSIIPEKRMILILILFIIGYSLLPHAIGFINLRTFNDEEFNILANRFFYGAKFNCMAIGGLFGYSFAKEMKFLKYFNTNVVVFISTTAAIGLWLFKFELKYFNDEFFAALFTIMLFALSTNRNVNIDTRTSKFLGRISFGIYMYHWIILLLVIDLIPFNDNNIIYNFLLYFVVLSLTIIISWLSFKYFESYFLRIKQNYKS